MTSSFYTNNGLYFLTKFLTNSNDLEKKEQSLACLVNASQFEEEYKLKIAEEGVIDILIDLINNEEKNLEVRDHCFTIISNLCKDCNKNKKQFRSKGGVDLLIRSLKETEILSSERNALYTVSLIDCIWNSILGNKKSEAAFLDNEGFYVMMEFLESSDPMHRKMTLSCLSLLVENIKSIPYFDDWNSNKTMSNSTQILLGIYAEEDKKFGVRYKDGVLLDYDRPLDPRSRKTRKPALEALIAKNKENKKNEDSEDEESMDPNDVNEYMATAEFQKTVRSTKLKIFERLREALNAGEADSTAGAEAILIRILKEKSRLFDLRGIVREFLWIGCNVNWVILVE